MNTRFDSVKRLVKTFRDLSVADAENIRDLVRGEIDPLQFEAARKYAATCSPFVNLPVYHIAMYAIDSILEGFGVEYLSKGDRPVAEYVNLGDTYTPTIIYVYATGRFHVGSWGDFVESNRL